MPSLASNPSARWVLRPRLFPAGCAAGGRWRARLQPRPDAADRARCGGGAATGSDPDLRAPALGVPARDPGRPRGAGTSGRSATLGGRTHRLTRASERPLDAVSPREPTLPSRPLRGPKCARIEKFVPRSAPSVAILAPAAATLAVPYHPAVARAAPDSYSEWPSAAHNNPPRASIGRSRKAVWFIATVGSNSTLSAGASSASGRS